MLYAATVKIPVNVERDVNGIYIATSPMVKGLVVVSKDHDKLTDVLVPQAMQDLTTAELERGDVVSDSIEMAVRLMLSRMQGDKIVSLTEEQTEKFVKDVTQYALREMGLKTTDADSSKS